MGAIKRFLFSAGFQLTLSAIVVPVLLIALGLWQIDRGRVTQAELPGNLAQAREVLAEVTQIAADNPMELLQFGDESFNAIVAQGYLETDVKWLQREATGSAIRYPLAFVTLAGGVLGLIGGLLGLILPAIAGARAKRSRAQLIASFSRLRRVLPFLLGATALGLGLGSVGAMGFEAATLPMWESVSGRMMQFIAVCGIGAVLMLWLAIKAIFAMRRVFAAVEVQTVETRARQVTEAEAPALWAFVRDIAARIGTAPPDNIVTGLTEGYFVTENPVRIYPEERVLTGRTLNLSAPMMELLDEAENTAIIGHELAHFAGEDTQYSQRFAPLYATFERSLLALGAADERNRTASGVSLGHYALSRFQSAVGHTRRLRELEADRRGLLDLPPGAAASALLRSSAAFEAQDHVTRLAGDRVELRENLVAAMADLVAERGLPDPASFLEVRQPHPYDAHPPTVIRIEALGVPVDGALIDRANRAHDPAVPSFGRRMFAQWDAFCEALSADYHGAAVAWHDAERAELQAAAADMPEGRIEVFSNHRWLGRIYLAIGLLICGAAAAWWVWMTVSGMTVDLHIPAVVAVVGLGFVLIALLLLLAGRKPVMILDREGVHSRHLKAPVRWLDLAGLSVTATSTIVIVLALTDDAPLPERTGRWRVSVDAKNRTVRLGLWGVRGMKAVDLDTLLRRFAGATHARARLDEMDHPKVATGQAAE